MTATVPNFDTFDLAKCVEQLPVEAIHALPFGAIRLDAYGKTIFFSDTERRQSGYRDNPIGHSFFTEIAPCMNNSDFKERIDNALAFGRLNIRLQHVGDFRRATTELNVRVQSASGGGCWIFLQRMT